MWNLLERVGTLLKNVARHSRRNSARDGKGKDTMRQDDTLKGEAQASPPTFVGQPASARDRCRDADATKEERVRQEERERYQNRTRRRRKRMGRPPPRRYFDDDKNNNGQGDQKERETHNACSALND